MASYVPTRPGRSQLAAVDLSAKQFYFVGDNGSGKYNVVGSATGAIGAGFLMNNPALNEACEIASNGGGAKGVCAATISAAKTELKANALGTLLPALDGDIVVAISMEAAAVSDIFEINPVYYIKGAATLSLLAAVDLSTKQFFYVGEDGSGTYNIAGGVRGAIGSGFLQNAPISGAVAIIHGPGYTRATAIAGATITGAEIELKANAVGKLETALVGDVVVALSTASAILDGEISVIPVLYQKDAGVSIALLAAADLTSGIGLYVGDNGSAAINVIGGINGGLGYGFLANSPNTGEAALIVGPGFQSASAVAGATITGAKIELKANALGKLETALPGDIVVALSTASAVVDGVISVVPVLYTKDSDFVSFDAAGDLTSSQYLYVGDSSGDVAVVGGATGALGYGFLQNAPNTGEDAIINGPGYSSSKAISGAAVSIMTELMANAAGKLIDTTAAGDIVVALSLESSVGADETIEVIPVLYRKHA